MPPLLSIRDLGVTLGERRVLEGLSLELAQGEHVLLAGPSGCGKTTLLRAIAGLIAPAEGAIEIEGREASAAGRILVPPHERPIGYLFQGDALWPHLDALQHLMLVQTWRGVPRAERGGRARELLEWFGLAGLERRRPATLSGGEAHRLALARALVTRPRLLLLDEPLGPLDGELRTTVLERLEGLRRSIGFGILHVTHDPAEAASRATRALRLEHGRLSRLEVARA